MSEGMAALPTKAPDGFMPSLPPSLEIPVDGKVRGWRVLGFHYSCIPNPVYPWNPEVVKAMWEFEPSWVPMWVTHEVITDSMDTSITFGNHAIGRVVDNPKGDCTDYFEMAGFHVDMPKMPCQGIRFRRPTHMELLIPWWNRYPALPFGPYAPFDWSTVKALREIHMEPDPRELQRILIDDPRKRWEIAKEKQTEEREYINRDFQRYAMKRLASVSDAEEAEYLRAVRTPGGLKEDPKPFVHIQRENP